MTVRPVTYAADGGPIAPRLSGRLLERAPGMETTGEAVRFVAFSHQAQLPGVLSILGPHMLDIDLKQARSKVR